METNFDSFLEKVLSELRDERSRIDQVILDLERLQQGGQKRRRGRPRGRPPGTGRLGRPHILSASGEI